MSELSEKIRCILKKEGLKSGTKQHERRRAQLRWQLRDREADIEQRRKYYQKNKVRIRARINHRYWTDPEYRQRNADKSRRRKKNPRVILQDRLRKRRWLLDPAVKRRVLRNQRRRYHANKLAERAKIYHLRYKRDPSKLVGSAIQRLRRRDISLSEYSRLVDTAIALINEKDAGAGGSKP